MIAKRKIRSLNTGTAILETIVGVLFLMPIFFLLMDVIGVVIAQSINDDLAKQAARYESVQPTDDTGTTAGSLATSAAVAYVNGTKFATAQTGLVCQAEVVSALWTQSAASNTYTVTVTTQIKCNLPIAVPFGGPSYQLMKSQGTWGLMAVAPGS